MKRRLYIRQLKDGNISVTEHIPVHKLMEDFYRIIKRVFVGYTITEVKEVMKVDCC